MAESTNEDTMMTLPASQILTILIVLFGVACVLVACSGVGPRTPEPSVGGTVDEICSVGECETATVDRVIDGDTVDVVTQAGNISRVRVLGIDTPETVHPERPVECMGPEASAATNELLPVGMQVTVVADAAVDQQDRYGRELAHIWADGVNLGHELLLRGLATTTTFPHSLTGQYADAQDAAEQRAVGLWGRC